MYDAIIAVTLDLFVQIKLRLRNRSVPVIHQSSTFHHYLEALCKLLITALRETEMLRNSIVTDTWPYKEN